MKAYMWDSNIDKTNSNIYYQIILLTVTVLTKFLGKCEE